MPMQKINDRIQSEICRYTIRKLSDENLMGDYLKCDSVIKSIALLQNTLNKHNVDADTCAKIIEDYTLNLIPAGTKGVIRGNKFNKIIQTHIETMGLDKRPTNPGGMVFDATIFDVCFEKKCPECETSEVPDWYIRNKNTNKVLIGMNQLDLCGGGQQLNRGYKYLVNNIHNTEKSNLLCVICNEMKFKTTTNKAFKLFEVGFRNNTLCYIGNLQHIIYDYFGLDNTGLNL